MRLNYGTFDKNHLPISTLIRRRKLQSQLSAKDVESQKAVARVQAQLSTKDNDHQKELARLKSQFSTKENDHQKEIARLKSSFSTKEGDHEKQLVQLKKAMEQESEKTQRRTQAEMADLKATISRLEVDLMKV
jgi:hypothetical protein